ncbi:sulfite exporter TauE/SafE family protein, partial [Francisella tularensis subsp. holarctica]|nr:sulfite exporter TauE/SafE family protein [Francisella tularensis subsp. holarctica]
HSVPLLISSGLFALARSLRADNYLGIISQKILKNLFITLMFVSSIVMIV